MTQTSSSDGRASRGAIALAGVVLFGLVLAACSSSTNTAATTTTASPGGTPSATTSAGSSGGSSLSSRIGALSAQVQAAEKTTFKAVYTTTGSGSNQTVTIEQSPPKSVFAASSGGSDINTGTTSYFCSTSNGQDTCYNAGASNPLASLAAIFSPATVITELKAAQTQAAAHAAGYDVSFSTQSFAGQSATCATFTASGMNVKYCVTTQGVLAYAGSNSGSFTLTSYSSSPPASDFAVPAGATVVTIP
ncbi:MAG TPA: hypothetical protein VN799_10655 [Acidimicrobiales bacterium]|nr:hypothetical protein [Acidimicrobiales bacterium]